MNKEGKIVFIGKIICTYYYKNCICSAPWKIENCPVKAYKCKLKIGLTKKNRYEENKKKQ